jgi:parvulin-like peptidyl-prolyl isomerase
MQINGVAFTAGEFQEMTKLLPPLLRAALDSEKGRTTALNWMIDWKLILAEAQRSALDREPDVQAAIAAAREKILVSEYFNRFVKQKISVSEEEVGSYYAKNREEFKSSEAIRVSHILVRSREEAQNVLELLEHGGDFSRIAAERSIDPSRRNGGQMGWVERKILDPDFAKAAFALAESKISGIVHTSLGYHIIRLDDTRPPEYLNYDEVKQRIAEKIKQQLVQELLQQVSKDLRGKATVVTNEDLLRTLGTEN